MGRSIAGRTWGITAGAVLTSALLVAGCGDFEDATFRDDINRPPETYLAVAPDSASEVFHKYMVKWAGFDVDGVVTRYRIATLSEERLYGGLNYETQRIDIEAYLYDILFNDDNPSGSWFETDATESLFTFRADEPNSRTHSIYITSIDNEGKKDQSPAAVNFMAIDYALPQIELFMSSNIDTIWRPVTASGITFPAYQEGFDSIDVRIKWEGYDPDGVIDSLIYRIDSSAARRIYPYEKVLNFVYRPGKPLESDVFIGFHEFKLLAIDDANALSDEYVARFTINRYPDTFVDSVWAFRDSKQDSVDEVLIYPSDDPTIRVWHFGRLRFKFHGTDEDKFPDTDISPAFYTWNVKGTLIRSSPTWLDTAWSTGEYIDGELVFTDTFDVTSVLDTDSPVTLIIRSRDELGTVDATPATLVLSVNYSPVIEDLFYTETSPGVFLFEWVASDPDEDIGWGSGGKAALMSYRYRIDSGPWVVSGNTEIDPGTNHYYKSAEVSGVAPGDHVFTLEAYNKDYFTSRFDRETVEFTVE